MSGANARRALRWPAAWIAGWWALLVLLTVLALMPGPPDPLPLRHADKLYHLLGYALLAGWTVQLWQGHALRARLLAVLLLGLLLEALQAAVPWRSADPLDALANALGVGLGALLARTPARHLLVTLAPPPQPSASAAHGRDHGAAASPDHRHSPSGNGPPR